jgi:Secretion system C-terminal sorting domain
MKRLFKIMLVWIVFWPAGAVKAQVIAEEYRDAIACSAFRADTTSSSPACPSIANGNIHSTLFSIGDSIEYEFLNFNYSAVLDSGRAADSGAINFSGLAAGTYHLVISDSSCTTEYTFTLFAPSQPNYSGNTFRAVCYSDSVTSGCLNVSGGQVPYQFTWSNPEIIGGCPDNVPPGNYSVTITDANNCIDIVPNVVVFRDSSISALNVYLQQGQYFDSVTIAVSGGAAPYSINWGDGLSSLSGDTSEHRYITEGIMIIDITDGVGCSVYDSIVSSFASSITQPNDNPLKIYPNPATNQLFIENDQIAIDEIDVIDVTSKLMQRQYLNGSRQAVLNISALSNGVYLLNVKSGGQEYHSRFVKAP